MLTIKVDLKCPCGCDDLTLLAVGRLETGIRRFDDVNYSRREVLTSPAATIHASSLTLQNTFRENILCVFMECWILCIKSVSYLTETVWSVSTLDKLYL